MEIDRLAVAFLRHDAELCCYRRRSDDPVASDAWTAITGQLADGDDLVATARAVVASETGLDPDAPELVRTGGSLEVDGSGQVLSPVLFDVPGRTFPIESDCVAREWLPATELLRRETFPGLWNAYERVAPSVRSIAAADEHGAALLSIRALEVLRDRAGVVTAELTEREDDWTEADATETDAADDQTEAVDELVTLTERLCTARPSMAVVRNRLLRALGDRTDPAAIEAAAIDGIDRALTANEAAVDRAADLVDGTRLLTISWSGTVRDVLSAGPIEGAFVAESRPACEGIDLSETVADELPVTVCTDAAVGHVLASEPVDAVLVGADTILPDGRVVNKTGTRTAALAAANEGCPVYVVAASDKITTREAVNIEHGDASAIYDGPADLDVHNPTFDVTPSESIEAIVTERGVHDPDDVAAIAEELRELETTVEL